MLLSQHHCVNIHLSRQDRITNFAKSEVWECVWRHPPASGSLRAGHRRGAWGPLWAPSSCRARTPASWQSGQASRSRPGPVRCAGSASCTGAGAGSAGWRTSPRAGPSPRPASPTPAGRSWSWIFWQCGPGSLRGSCSSWPGAPGCHGSGTGCAPEINREMISRRHEIDSGLHTENSWVI